MPLILSGVFLGLAIFTKIPAIAIIPLIGFIIIRDNNKNKNKNFKAFGLWLIPVISIPLIWPAYGLLSGQFDLWLKDVLWQANRSDRLLASLNSLLQTYFEFPLFVESNYGKISQPLNEKQGIILSMSSRSH